MTKVFVFCLFLYANVCLSAESTVLSAREQYPQQYQHTSFWDLVGREEYQEAVTLIDQWIQAEKEKSIAGFLLVEKAKLLQCNQQHVRALESFLEALDVVGADCKEISGGERREFLDLFPLYSNSLNSREACEELMQTVYAKMQFHPEYLSLNYYLAACFANYGDFCAFFDRFFISYKRGKTCFLSWKIQGVVYMRLFEGSSDESTRDVYRDRAVFCFKKAFNEEPRDGSLLIKILFVLLPNERKCFLEEVVEVVESLDSPMRRTEFFLLIQQALEVRALSVARRCITKASVWYAYSKALGSLNEQLNALESNG